MNIYVIKKMSDYSHSSLTVKEQHLLRRLPQVLVKMAVLKNGEIK